MPKDTTPAEENKLVLSRTDIEGILCQHFAEHGNAEASIVWRAPDSFGGQDVEITLNPL